MLKKGLKSKFLFPSKSPQKPIEATTITKILSVLEMN